MSLKYDWYQTDSKVFLTVLLKNAEEKNYTVNISNEKVVVKADDCHLELYLYLTVIPERSTHKATPYKVEIILAKGSAERWENLEKQKPAEVQSNSVPQLRNRARNWDEIAREIAKQEAEEAQGEEALQNLFKKIYKDSDEEVRKAMNKSFMESGGTVLSTNWQEVGDQTVEVKPPDGTEFKKWNE